MLPFEDGWATPSPGVAKRVLPRGVDPPDECRFRFALSAERWRDQR
jgi:hypothetical protein